MFSVSTNGIITLNKGDSFTLPLFINIGTTLEPVLYPLAGEDKLYFGVMEPGQEFEDALIKKVFTCKDYDSNNKCVSLHFSSSDTKYLVPGVYYYSAKLVREAHFEREGNIIYESEQLVDTIIPKTKLFLLE